MSAVALPTLEPPKAVAWVRDGLKTRGLPAVETGSYYTKAFRPEGELPDALRPLARDGLVWLCFKPPQV